MLMPGRSDRRFYRGLLIICLLVVAVMIISCSESGDGAPVTTTSGPDTAAVETAPVESGTGVDGTVEPDSTIAVAGESTPATTDTVTTTLPASSIPTTTGEGFDPVEGLHPLVRQATASWPTEWGTNSIDLGELLLGLHMVDPRDGIPPIDHPVFETVSAASEWLSDRVPGTLVLLGGEARFYPLGILHRHEIVNDEIAGIPVAVTYCPLCNTALTFDRRVGGQVLRFGVSGLLRNSDLVMWDDQTVSLWQQVTGEAIVGSATGAVLTPVPTAIVSFGEFADAYPEGISLSRDSGLSAPYIYNPYEGYSNRSAPYPFFTGEVDPRYRALERVVGVTEGGGATAYPFPVISEVGVVNDIVGGVPVAVFWGGDTADALDTSRLSEGKAIGTGLAYLRTVDGRELTFIKQGHLFRDQETSSEWTLLGQAISGPLAGARLELAMHRNEFWFVWGAFYPDGEVYEG